MFNKDRSGQDAHGSHARTVAADSPPGDVRDERVLEDTDDNHDTVAPTRREEHAYRKEQFGGVKAGAVFYGWLEAVALTILLVGVVSAIATGLGSTLDVTQAEAELRAGEIGVTSAIAILSILAIGYLAGGYVAGRLARFNGARQGFAVWALGLIITVVVVVIGLVFGDQYNVFDRVSLPSLPVRADEFTAGGIITFAAVLAGTLVAAVFGGMLGQRYHSKIDRTTL